MYIAAPLDVVSALIVVHPPGASTPANDGSLPLHWAAYAVDQEGAAQSPVSAVAELLAAYPDGANHLDNAGAAPDLSAYPADAILAAIRAAASARRRFAMRAWLCMRAAWA